MISSSAAGSNPFFMGRRQGQGPAAKAEKRFKYKETKAYVEYLEKVRQGKIRLKHNRPVFNPKGK